MPTPPYVFPPFGNIPNTWVLFGDGHFGLISSEGAGGAPEILVVADTSAGDVIYTLPDPATLTDPKTTINVKNINGGTFSLYIYPGVAGKIDNSTNPIRTSTNNQSYRFRLAESADSKLPDGSTPTGWVTIETCFGWDDIDETPPPPVTEGCLVRIPDGVVPMRYDFAQNGTWTKPEGDYTYAVITVIGSGGGAGGAVGSNNTDFATGGQGGGGGEKKTAWFNFADMPSSAVVTIGAGGDGGDGGVGDGTGNPIPPTPGTDGGDTSFGNPGDPWYLLAHGGKGGAAHGGVGGGSPGNWPSGDCYGAPGAQYNDDVLGVTVADGGSSIHGAPGGAHGGTDSTVGLGVNRRLTEHPWRGWDGGTIGTNDPGDGGLGGDGYVYDAYTTPTNGEPGSDGTSGDSKTPGTAGGGGGVLHVTFPNGSGYHGGKGGNGGWPGAGGGGGGGGFCGFVYGGGGGNGADGAVCVECY